MAEKGIDISSHRAQEISAALLQEADVVFVMEPGQKEALAIEFPDFMDKVHLLTELIGGAYPISDPINGPIEGFYQTAERLDDLLETGFEQLLVWAQVKS